MKRSKNMGDCVPVSLVVKPCLHRKNGKWTKADSISQMYNGIYGSKTRIQFVFVFGVVKSFGILALVGSYFICVFCTETEINTTSEYESCLLYWRK